jgi:hypothetical protein
MTRLTLAALLAVGLLGGCAETVEQNVGACQAAPPLREEKIPKAPLAEYVQTWQPGHWDWDGHNYIWVPGAWVKRDNTTQWMQGYWDRPATPGPCVWVPAHWM